MHVLDPAETAVELELLVFEVEHFLLRQLVISAVRADFLDLAQAVNALPDNLKISQRPAQPAVIDVEHLAARRFSGNDLPRLPFSADEQHPSARCREVLQKYRCRLKVLHRLLQVDDVNAVARRKDVRTHLRIPAPRLMPIVDTRLQQLPHVNRYCQLQLLICRLTSAAAHRLKAPPVRPPVSGKRTSVRSQTTTYIIFPAFRKRADRANPPDNARKNCRLCPRAQ